MTKREQADEIVTNAFEAHLAEIVSRHGHQNRRLLALDRVRDEVVGLAAEKGVNVRTLKQAVARLAGRIYDHQEAK